MTWNPSFDWWLIAAIGAVAFVFATLLIFRSERLGRRWMRAPIWLLRLACLALLLVILANPVRNDVVSTRGGDALEVVLVDTSQSMALEKPASRLERARDWSQSVAEAAPGCRVYGFGEDVDFNGATTLKGGSTRLARALRRVLESNPERRLANIVVVSDGRIHDRAELADALALARQRRVAISTHTIGRDEPPLNAAIRACRVERSAPTGTRVRVDVQVATSGLTDGTELQLSLKDDAGVVLASAPVTVRKGAAETQLALEAGLRTAAYTVSLTRIDGELTHADNDFTFTLEIADPKIRVFLAEGSLTSHDMGDERWAAGRFFTEAFRRAGDIECELFQMVQQDTPGQPLFFVRGFDERERHVLEMSRSTPRGREEWWRYDVIIISDIARTTFPEAEMEWVRQLVAERGGGFCMIGGNLSFDTGSYDQTLWEKLIPVDCLEFGFGHGWRGVQPEFPKTVRNHPVLRLASDPVLNDAILDVHPEFRGFHDIRRAKPGAVTLATKAGSTEPLIAVQEYGRGRTMAFLSDAAGGWGEGGYQGYWGPDMLDGRGFPKAPEGTPPNEFYNRFWVNSVRWLAENSVRRGHKSILGLSDAITYRPGEVVKVGATLLSVFDPAEMLKQSVGARLALEGQERVALTYDRDRKEFVGQLRLPDSVRGGEVAVVFDSSAGGAPISDEIKVRVMQLDPEFETPAPDPQLMADIAQAGGGAVLETPADALAAFAAHRQEAATESIPFSEPLWSRAWVWALLLGLFATEWTLRRFAAA